MQKRAAIYVRVSTEKQTVENQVAALRQIAERRGWEVTVQRCRYQWCQGPRWPPWPRPDAQGCVQAQVRRHHGLGDRPGRPLANRSAGHDPDAGGMRRRSVPRSAVARHHYTGRQADVFQYLQVARMPARLESDGTDTWLVNLPPTWRQTRIALFVGVALLVGLRAAAPFADALLPRIDAFIPAIEIAVIITDFITAACCFRSLAFIIHARFWHLLAAICLLL
jgi:resolvase-like protein